VQLEPQTRAARSLEDGARLVGGEDTRLAEDIGEASETLSGDGGEHLVG
jgi:hypothetical protein